MNDLFKRIENLSPEKRALLLARLDAEPQSPEAREEDGAQKRLIAYVVAGQADAPSSADLRDYLKRQLPEYMIPASFVLLEEFPLTPNGKVDRRALPRLEPTRTGRTDDAAPAVQQSAIEEMLADMWAEILRVERVSVHDNFFDLGGHSLLAMQLMSRVREAFGVDIPVRDLFEEPTLGGLAGRVEIQLRAGQGTHAPPLVAVPRREVVPLSFAQQRLWFMEQLRPGNAAYNIPAALRLTGALDVYAFERSLNEIVRRHEVLRTNFRAPKGEPAQFVAAYEPELLVVDNLEVLPETEREVEVERRATEEAARPFDLGRERMLRARLLRLGAQEHVLLLTMHHIVADDWSFSILIRELSTLYQAFSGGQPSPLPELPIQYADFACWQRAWLTGEVLEEQLAYWREQLAGMPHVFELPTDRPRPAVQSSSGSVETLRLNASLTGALKQLSRAEGVTLFMTLLAAFKILLSRYARREDIVVGAPIAGRNRAETEGLIGFFVNTLVLRTDLSGEPTFRELLARVRKVSLEAYAHQDLPFDKLVEELQPARNLSHMPLVQIVLALQNAPQDDFQLTGLTLGGVEAESETAKFDLTLNMSESEGELFGALRYSTDLFDAATARRMIDHLTTLLEGIVTSPDRRISELPLLKPEEERQLLERWTSGARDFSPSLSGVHQLFEAQVERRPEATALVFEGERLSYAELNRRANQLAHLLRAVGVGAETRVGLMLERSSEMVVGLLGILKAGGAYVPLDPAYPHERLAFLRHDAGLHALLTVQKFADKSVSASTKVILLDADATELARQPEDNPRHLTSPDNLAYIIYTSGSTGQPKGTLVTHGNVTRLFAATEHWFNFDDADVWTLFHSSAFDFSVWELWGALAYGGKLVVVPYDVSRSPEEFYALLVREGVTVLNQTPSAFRQLMAAEESAAAHLDLGDAGSLALRFVIFGGEALELSSLRPWFERHSDKRPRLVNMYGITETTVHVTYRPLTCDDARSGVGSRIGVALPDLQVYVLDPQLRPVPVGVVGELYVGGAGVARGYLNHSELTAERFVPHPYSPRPGERLYRSGDLVRYLADGDLEYFGRNDQQVKIRGYRIELGEIEAALAGYEGVRECVVAVREDAVHGDRRLVAYLVWERESKPAGLEELRGFLREKLAEHMIPASFVMLDALPLTAHGKIDRRALPAPGHERPALERQYRPPQGALESLLASMWQEVLRLDAVGVDDDFFGLGGDSIKGAVFINRLQERLGEIVHVVTIFNYTTIAKLAAYLEEQYPAATARVSGRDSRARSGDADDALLETSRVDEQKLARAAQLITPLPTPAAKGGTKNPPAIFVLSAPRSGSTLFRVMLAGHPQLFAPPELELLTFNTLEERRNSFSGADSFWLEGTIRALMELKDCEAAEAKELMQLFEARGLSTKEFYAQMQQWLGERRLVDKSPSYALHPSILERAEENFDGALYIHLLRHPLGMIRSFEEVRLDQIFFRYEHPFSRRELAEIIWLISNRNILDFLRRVPAGRHHLVRFEDLLAQPEVVMGGVCRFLDVELHPDMLQPYRHREKRMTDGIYAESRMLGDVKFNQYTGIDARTGTRWKEQSAEDSLGSLTVELAGTLGYQTEQPTVTAISPDATRPVRSHVQASALIHIHPGGTNEPLFLVHPGAGAASDYVHLSRRLGAEQPLFGLPGLDPLHPRASIEEMASQAIEALRTVQPTGAPLIGGWSFGALVAFETAQQLYRQGSEPSLLALFDPMPPTLDDSSILTDFTDASDPLLISRDIAALAGWDAALFDSLAQSSEDEQLHQLFRQAHAASLLPPGVTTENFSDWLLLYHAKLRAAQRYRPQTYPGRITIFQAADPPVPHEGSSAREDSNHSAAIMWKQLSAQPVNIIVVPGSHHTMMLEPHVRVLAEQVKPFLIHR